MEPLLKLPDKRPEKKVPAELMVKRPYNAIRFSLQNLTRLYLLLLSKPYYEKESFKSTNCILYIDEISESNFLCEVCGEVYSTHGELEDHAWSHTSEKLHECHICHIKFTSASSLRYHQCSKHDLNFFTCNSCNETFLNFEAFNEHKLVCTAASAVNGVNHQLTVYEIEVINEDEGREIS